MEKLQLIRKLLRVEQWYKNLLIFAPLLFAHNAHPWFLLILGFFGFCSISSITYICNDWLDRAKDRLHPTKKNRPLASGKVTGTQALLVAAALTLFVLVAITQLGTFYAALVGIYAALTTAYSFGLKNIPFLDILLICANFILRMMAGLESFPSFDELSYFGFLFAFILVFLTHKRRADIVLLGAARASQHKPVLHYYTPTVCYMIRGAAYLLLLFSFYQLYEEGWPLAELAALMALLIYTSTLFLKNTELVIKPHYLLRNGAWVALALLTIVSAFI